MRFRKLLRFHERAALPQPLRSAEPGVPALRGERVVAFYQRCAELGLAVDRHTYWYHTIDLGRGLVTPGVFDLRPNLAAYGFPADLSGRHVLDVGSATGYFAFELERRGATVTAVDIPSLDAMDRFPGQSLTGLVAKAQRHLTGNWPDEPLPGDPALIYRLWIGEPFDFCARMLGSQVRRQFTTIYRLPETGRARFDVVFVGDVLLHTLDPLAALAAVADVCAGTLIIAQNVPSTADPRPALFYLGGDQPEDDLSEWWRPNLTWFQQVLRKLGFRTVEVVGSFETVFLPTGQVDERTVIHARR